jgi:AraC family transcriptional activator of mtrCDE
MDWLSRLLDMTPVSGRLEVRCHYGAPWQLAYARTKPGEIPYHVMLGGSAILEDPSGGPAQHLAAGDIVLMPHGSTHVLHDGSGKRPARVRAREGLNLTIRENAAKGDRIDMLCGRFIVAPPHDRLVRAYLPSTVVVRAASQNASAARSTTGAQLAGLVALLRSESAVDRLGGHAMLNALSAALFTLALRLASESAEAPVGLLALAGHPRLAPALTAMLHEPARPWTLPALARLCNMSRATLARHFQDRVGRSASDLLTDIRMNLAANELRKPSLSTEAVAEAVGYDSVAAFRRVFKQRMGMSPADWRRAAQPSNQVS